MGQHAVRNALQLFRKKVAARIAARSALHYFFA